LLTLAILLLIIGGLFILIGYRASLGALMILIYWVPVTFIVHSFWNDPVPERRMQSIQFMKNIAIIGGLMIILVNGAGRFSIKRLIAASRPPKAKW
jgi:putative oxidoreductase